MIAVENLFLQFGSFKLENISFRVSAGQYAMLMGKTGCGKTSLLEAICGLKPTVSGVIRLEDRDVTRLRAAERGIGYVPQDSGLFCTLTVLGHMALPLQIRHWTEKEVARRVDELAELLGLEHLLERTPAGLSGGEARRVALGRALSFYPRYLCLDEPLSNLDDETRGELYSLLQSVKEHTRATVLHVSHDIRDAERLADRLFSLSNGAIHEQLPSGKPE